MVRTEQIADYPLKALLKKWLSRALGKTGRPVVVVFLSGDRERSRAMALEMRALAPDYPHVIVGPAPADREAYAYSEEVIEVDPRRPWSCWRPLGRRWIALAPFVWSGGTSLRWMPWLLAPHKLLAFNGALERHHVRLRTPIASWRFLRGEAVGDIFRPTRLGFLRRLPALLGFGPLLAWWAARGVGGGGQKGPDFPTTAAVLWRWSARPGRWRSVLEALGAPAATWLPLLDAGLRSFAGRPLGLPGRPLGGRRRIAVVTPYLPFPLAHGGAIRIYNLLRAAAESTDIWLFAFAENETVREVEPLLEFCAKVVLVSTLRWEPRPPLRLLPRGVGKFRSPAMRAAIATTVAEEKIPLVQVEFTQLAHLGPSLPARTILVEHDVTFDLHRQQRARERGWQRLPARLEEWRWRRYELKHASRYDRVVTMSEEDSQRLAEAGLRPERLRVAPNGVDLERFRPRPAPDCPELLFIGSFRHFPNVVGAQFLLEQVWPIVQRARPDARLTVVAGQNPAYYWRLHTGEEPPTAPAGTEWLEFVEDVRPLYARAALVLVPLLVSAGTNIKVLEGLAMQRAVISTPAGVAGLGVTSGENVMVAASAEGFAAAVLNLLADARARDEIARRGRAVVEAHYGWPEIEKNLEAVWDEVLH